MFKLLIMQFRDFALLFASIVNNIKKGRYELKKTKHQY